MADVRVVVRHDQIEQLVREASLREGMLAAAAPVVDVARAGAPHRTGRGAGTIHAEAALLDGEWDALVSWSQLGFYMYFQDVGTRRLPARRFLEHAVEVGT